MKVLLLGGSGMIGSAVNLKLINNNVKVLKITKANIWNKKLDLEYEKLRSLITEINPTHIINCSGITRQRIQQGASTWEAIIVNTALPKMLDEFGAYRNIPILTIGTDCIYSGNRGGYTEIDVPDGCDVYSMTKILAEKLTPNTTYIRTSVVGPGKPNGLSLFEWFQSQPSEATLNGYINHFWNGITSKTLGEIIWGILNYEIAPGVQHLVPEGVVSKFEMLKIFKEVTKRSDLLINELSHKDNVNRTLRTVFPDKNVDIWNYAGYANVPNVVHLLRENLQI